MWNPRSFARSLPMEVDDFFPRGLPRKPRDRFGSAELLATTFADIASRHASATPVHSTQDAERLAPVSGAEGRTTSTASLDSPAAPVVRGGQSRRRTHLGK